MRVLGRKNPLTSLVIITMTSLLAAGCHTHTGDQASDSWDRVIAISEENARTAGQLINQDAESRQQIVELSYALQAERSEIGRQRDLLESDRKEWQRRERKDPVLAAAITTAGVLLACSMPLALVGALLWKRPPDESEVVAQEILIKDLVEAEALLCQKSQSLDLLEAKPTESE